MGRLRRRECVSHTLKVYSRKHYAQMEAIQMALCVGGGGWGGGLRSDEN